IPGISDARPAVRRAGRRPPWRPVLRPSNSAPISAARCGRRRIIAAWARTNRAPVLCPQAAAGRPQPPHLPRAAGLPVLGPMARDAADLALGLDILAGPDERADGIGYKLALPPPRHQELGQYRALLLDTHPLCPTAQTVSAALDRLATRLAAAGVAVA